MIRTFKALSALLTYPGAELQQAVGEIRQAIEDEALLSPAARAALQPLLHDLEHMDLYDLQERYVLLFDRSRTLSLNLFEHVHGESRERGPAMVDLLETYRAGGFELASSELPDHLPILLEFAALRPLEEARELMADAGHIIAALAERLKRRESPYAAVMAALAEFAGIERSSELVQQLLAVDDDDPEDLAALDEVWQEAEVVFGPDPNAGCPVSRELLAKMDPIPPKDTPLAAPAK